MKLKIIGMVLLSTTSLLLGGEGGDDAKKDAKQLQGTWIMVSAIRSGQEYPPEKLKGKGDLVFAGDTVKFLDTEEKQPDKITYKLDPTKKPKTIDMIPADKKLEPLLGVYELSGDTLKICFRATGEKRPTEFKSEENSGSSLYVLKRRK